MLFLQVKFFLFVTTFVYIIITDYAVKPVSLLTDQAGQTLVWLAIQSRCVCNGTWDLYYI